MAKILSTYAAGQDEHIQVSIELDTTYPDALNEAAATVRKLMRAHLEDVYELTVRVIPTDFVVE